MIFMAFKGKEKQRQRQWYKRGRLLTKAVVAIVLMTLNQTFAAGDEPDFSERKIMMKSSPGGKVK